MIAGNRLSRSADGIQENYRYDNCNRLTQMTRMTTQQEHLTYTYDRQGNMLSDGRNQYTYDDFGRLVLAVTAEGGIQKNCYDAEGLRTEMGENGRLVQFLYNENREVVAEKDYSGNIIRYIRGLGLISSDSENAKMYYHYVCDGQGSVSHIIRGGDKENGAAVQDKDQDRVLNHYEYDVFGNTISCEERVANRFRYQGEQYDPVTRQYYLRARYYNPVIGRFTQEDTYYGDGLNLYEYCRNNTITYKDPTGHNICATQRDFKSIKYFWYDREGRCSGRLDANANLVRTVYNMDGNPVMITGTRNVSLSDFRQRFHATEDEAGNFEERTPELRSLYTYDAQGNLVEASENGTDYHYTHDTEGRVLSKRAWGKTLYENHYDACGRLRELITGEQKTSYGYDKAGRLAEVCASNGIRAQYRYDRNDMQTEVLYGNGLRTSYTYDERSQLTGMETVLPGMSNPLFRSTYAYDANGCRISKTEQIRMDATTPLKVMETSYTYDAMERLTKESLNGAVTSYGYDLAGNRITKSTVYCKSKIQKVAAPFCR